MVAFGERWWTQLEPELFELSCNTNNNEHHTLMAALGQGVKVLAIALAPALVATLSTLPAVAIVLSTIAAKKVADAGLQTTCAYWAQSMARRVAEKQL